MKSDRKLHEVAVTISSIQVKGRVNIR